MSFRFRKSLFSSKLIRINVGKTGPSVSIGPRGLSAGISSQGSHVNIGLPGTGLSVRKRISQTPIDTYKNANNAINETTGNRHGSVILWVGLGLLFAIIKHLFKRRL